MRQMNGRYSDEEWLKLIRGLKLIAFDFDGVFTDGKVWTSTAGAELVVSSRKDTHRLPELKARGIKMVVISQEKNKVVEMRCKKMGIPCFYGVERKKDVLSSFVKDAGISYGQVAYVGDDINDFECLELACARFVIADGSEKCKKIADYITERKGGDHAVREICDYILNIFEIDRASDR